MVITPRKSGNGTNGTGKRSGPCPWWGASFIVNKFSLGAAAGTVALQVGGNKYKKSDDGFQWIPYSSIKEHSQKQGLVRKLSGMLTEMKETNQNSFRQKFLAN